MTTPPTPNQTHFLKAGLEVTPSDITAALDIYIYFNISTEIKPTTATKVLSEAVDQLIERSAFQAWSNPPAKRGRRRICFKVTTLSHSPEDVFKDLEYYLERNMRVAKRADSGFFERTVEYRYDMAAPGLVDETARGFQEVTTVLVVPVVLGGGVCEEGLGVDGGSVYLEGGLARYVSAF